MGPRNDPGVRPAREPLVPAGRGDVRGVRRLRPEGSGSRGGRVPRRHPPARRRLRDGLPRLHAPPGGAPLQRGPRGGLRRRDLRVPPLGRRRRPARRHRLPPRRPRLGPPRRRRGSVLPRAVGPDPFRGGARDPPPLVHRRLRRGRRPRTCDRRRPRAARRSDGHADVRPHRDCHAARPGPAGPFGHLGPPPPLRPPPRRLARPPPGFRTARPRVVLRRLLRRPAPDVDRPHGGGDPDLRQRRRPEHRDRRRGGARRPGRPHDLLPVRDDRPGRVRLLRPRRPLPLPGQRAPPTPRDDRCAHGGA